MNMQIPSLIEISPTNLLDLDEKVAYQHFFGKSLAEAEQLFDEAHFYVEDLGWMGRNAFDYYVCAYVDHLSSQDLEDIDLCEVMSVVLMRRNDENHHNIKKLISVITELRKKLDCGHHRKLELEYEDAVQDIMGEA